MAARRQRTGAETRVFVSHASRDRALATRLSLLIQRGLGLAEPQVFCSTAEGLRIPTGRDFIAHIERCLRGSRLAVLLVTPSYLDSSFCMAELGAFWMRRLETFPVTVPHVSVDQLMPLLERQQVSPVDNADVLEEMRERISAQLEITPDARLWAREKEAFLTEVGALLAAVQPSASTRLARYVGASPAMVQAFEELRECAGRVADPGVMDHTHPFAVQLRLSLSALASMFTAVGGAHCRACVKELETTDDNVLVISDLSRTAGSISTGDPVLENTDFAQLFEGDDICYCNNDLVEAYLRGEYRNSHWTPVAVRADKVSYRSTIVWPLARVVDHGSRSRSRSRDHTRLGFLCVDSPKVNSFNRDVDYGFGAAFAAVLYPMLLAWQERRRSTAQRRAT